MKAGKTVQELAAEIQRQQDNKRDFLIAAKQVEAFPYEDHMELGFKIHENDAELFTAPLTNNGHIQLANFVDIPKKYYDRMLTYPELLSYDVNFWLKRSQDTRLLRSLDGNIRAILSDKFRRLDNFDLAQNVLPMLNEAGATIESSEITENKLYIKAITHKVQAEVKKGDIVSAGLIISNSETGHGSLSVKPLVMRLVCMNGAIADDFSMKKYHVGKVQEMEEIEYSNETLHQEDKAFWMKVRDLVRFTLRETTFEKIVDRMREAADKKIGAPDGAIELVTKKYGLNENESGNILKHLIEGGDLTAWGLGNAVTRTAQDVESYDRSTELESIGYQIMNDKWTMN